MEERRTMKNWSSIEKAQVITTKMHARKILKREGRKGGLGRDGGGGGGEGEGMIYIYQ